MGNKRAGIIIRKYGTNLILIEQGWGKSLPNNIWTYLIIIGEVALMRLNYLKKGYQNFVEFDYDFELNKFKELSINTKFNAPVEKFYTLSKSLKQIKNKFDEENLLNSFNKNINIDIYIEFLIFVIQCTYYKQKWSVLSEFITKFNDLLFFLDYFVQLIVKF